MSNTEMQTILDSIKDLEKQLNKRIDGIEKRVIGLEERVSARFDRLETRMTNIEFFVEGLSAGKALQPS